MENIETNYPHSRNKLTLIITAVLLYIVTSPVPLIFGESNSPTQLINLFTVLALNLITFAWCYYDSLQRNESFGRGWGILILFLGFLALVIYLFKSRGFKRGLISTGKGLLILLGIIVGSATAMTITELILGI